MYGERERERARRSIVVGRRQLAQEVMMPRINIPARAGWRQLTLVDAIDTAEPQCVTLLRPSLINLISESASCPGLLEYEPNISSHSFVRNRREIASILRTPAGPVR